jgi:hypothetical protein
MRSEWSGSTSEETARGTGDTGFPHGEEDSDTSPDIASIAGTNGAGYSLGEPLETPSASRAPQEFDTIVWPETADKDDRQFTLANLMLLLVVISAGFATLQFTSIEIFAAGAGATAFGLLVLLALVPNSAMLRLAWWIALATYLAASTIAIL